MANLLKREEAVALFKAGKWQDQKGGFVHCLVNAFKMNVDDACTLAEYLVNTAEKHAGDTGKASLTASGQKKVKCRIGQKDIELPLLDGRIVESMTWACNAGKHGVSYGDSTFVFAPDIKQHVEMVVPMYAKLVAEKKAITTRVPVTA